MLRVRRHIILKRWVSSCDMRLLVVVQSWMKMDRKRTCSVERRNECRMRRNEGETMEGGLA
jgi:hypothetical protein